MSVRAKTGLSLAGALLSSTMFVAAVPASAQTLFDTLSQAYQTSPSLDAERSALRAVDENVPQALGGYRPSVSGEASTGASTVDTNKTDSEDVNPSEIGITVTQPIYTFGRTEAAVNKAEAQVQVERARLLATEQSVLLDAGTAYNDVFLAQATVDLNTNNEQVLQRQLEATRDRFNVGEITRTDVSLAESRVAGATAARINSEGNLVAQKAIYERVVGKAPGTLTAAASLDPFLPKSLDEALALANKNSPTLRAADQQVTVAQETANAADASLRPSISVTGSASYGYDNVSSVPNATATQGSIIAKLSVPIYQQGVEYSTVRASRQSLLQSKQELDQTRRETIDNVVRAWTALMTARAQIKSIRAQVEYAGVALDGVRQETNVGSRTVLDMLDSEQDLLDAQVSLASAQRDEAVAALNLMSAIGALTVGGLQLDVKAYDPTIHYNAIRSKWWGVDSN
jgi:outer membrane protein/adhesin transport system outer membrane protein